MTTPSIVEVRPWNEEANQRQQDVLVKTCPRAPWLIHGPQRQQTMPLRGSTKYLATCREQQALPQTTRILTDRILGMGVHPKKKQWEDEWTMDPSSSLTAAVFDPRSGPWKKKKS